MSDSGDNCMHCVPGGPEHPKIACFISDRRWWARPHRRRKADSAAFSRSSYWDSDTQPLVLLDSYNRDRRMVVGPKITKNGAPFHQLTLLVWGFTCAASCDAFTALMSVRNRKFRNRLVRGVRLAEQWHTLDPRQTQPLKIGCPAVTHQTEIARMCMDDDTPAFQRQMEQLKHEALRVLQRV